MKRKKAKKPPPPLTLNLLNKKLAYEKGRINRLERHLDSEIYQGQEWITNKYDPAMFEVLKRLEILEKMHELEPTRSD